MLAVEIGEDEGLGHLQIFGDCIDTRALKTAFIEELRGLLQDALTLVFPYLVLQDFPFAA